MKHVPPPAGEPLVDVPLPPAVPRAGALKALARLRDEAAAEIERLLTFLDATDGDADFEDDDHELDVDAEPDLGAFDRMTNQEKSWRQTSKVAGAERELDDCDCEDDDPAELGEVSGIADQDGLLEQIGGHHSFLGRVVG